jgi:hypothetical protein
VNALRSRWLVALLAPLLSVQRARAGNDDGVLLGNEAALTGGALTANVSDGSALWYNPAGLAAAGENDSVDVTASAFVLRRYRMPSLLSSNDDNNGSGSFTEVVTIPSALTYLRRVHPRLTLGLGLFSPQVNDVVLRSTLETTGNLDTAWQLLIAQKQSQYYAAGGLGWAITPRVSVGLTVMGGYFNAVTSSQTTGAVNDAAGNLVVFSVQSLRDEVTALGLEARLGLMARVHRAVSLGASLSGPGMTVYGARRVQGFQGNAGTVDSGVPLDFLPVNSDESGGQVGVYAPFKARFGVTYRPPWGGAISADADFASRAKNADLDLDRVFTWNARLGGTAPLSERLLVGAGVFSDRGPDRKSPDGTGPVHFYGLTLGGTYSTVRKLAPGERRDALTFASTAALRYAHGTGKALGYFFDGDTGDNYEQPVDLTIDEVSLHLGSSVYF